MGRRENLELRRLVLHFYLAGYPPKQVRERVGEVLGWRPSLSYIYRIIWEAKRKGVLDSPPAPSAWSALSDCIRGAKVAVLAAQEALAHSPVDVRRALKELELALRLLGDAQRHFEVLYLTFKGARVAR